jgi:phosphoserine phosphatase RsbU/P
MSIQPKIIPIIALASGAALLAAFAATAGNAEGLEGGGPPVGIFARSQYRSEHVLLHDGDVLVAYTDGLVEALNPQQEEFGEERLSDIVRSSLSLMASEICKRIATRLQAFVAESPRWDDITLVIMKVRPLSLPSGQIQDANQI